jgi:tape measure domain-containing protein
VSEGIEFLLELQANIEGATKMVRELTKVEAATYKADAALKAAEKHTNALGRAMHKGKQWAGEFGQAAASSFTGMFAATAVWDSIKNGIRLLVDLGEQALHAAGEAEQTRLAFQSMLGVEPANEMLDYLDDLAKHTQFTDGELKQLGGQLLRAGYSGLEFKRALTAALDVAARPGDPMANAAQGVELLSKMMLKGSIGARELLGAGVNVNAFYKDLAEDTGLGIKEVKERLQQGKIDVGVMREAFFRSLQKPGGKIGDADFAMSKTLVAKTKKFKDIIPNLFEELEKSGGIKNVTAMLGKLVEVFDPGAPAGKKIIGGLEKMIDKFGKFVTSVDFDKFADRTASALSFIGDAIGYGATALEVLYTLNPLRLISYFADGVRDIFKSIGGFFSGLYGIVTAAGPTLWEKASTIGTALWQGFKAGVLGGITAVTDAIKGFGAQAIFTLKEVLGIKSPSKVFAGLGRQSAAGYKLGIEASAPDLNAVVEHAFAPPIYPSPAPVSGAAGASASMQIGGITVNVQAAAGQDARETGTVVATAIRAELLSLLEHLRAEGAGA